MQEVKLEGCKFSAIFVAEINSGCRSSTHHEASNYQVYWWQGEGKIVDKETDKDYRFLFYLPWWSNPKIKYLQSLEQGLILFYLQGEHSWKDERVSIEGRILDSNRVADVFCQIVVDLVIKSESEGGLIANIELPKVYINQLIAEGAISKVDGQIALPLCE